VTVAVLAIAIPLFLVNGQLLAQDVSDEPHDSIAKLLNLVPKAVVSGDSLDQFFSSDARVQQKAALQALQKKAFLKFEIADYALKDLNLEDPEHASLPVTIRWSTRTEEASKATTLRFVRDHGTWYFADADFWEVSVAWFFVPLILLAIAYGCGAVIMYRHVDRHQWVNQDRKTLWQSFAMVPFVPFFYFAKKPWKAA
jgi:hypothetical protein